MLSIYRGMCWPYTSVLQKFWFMLILPIFAVYFLVTVRANGDDGANKQPVCGTVRTATGKTVTLREGTRLEALEFQDVEIRKLKDSLFSPVAEHGCVIKLCGYTWTEETFNDPQAGFLTRNYADCQMIKQGNDSKISSNIYNELFNVTSISCACKKDTLDCKVTCANRIKSKIDWKDDQCAILFEEINCGQCWFKPMLLDQGGNYTTDNSHFIHTMIIRDKCSVKQTFNNTDQNRSSPIFYNEFTKDIDKSAFRRGFSTFDCTCHQKLTTAIPWTPSATPFKNAVYTRTQPTNALQISQTRVSCATITPVTSKAVRLFENSTLSHEDFERVRVGKLANATFEIGSNWNDQINCVLEICGLSKTAHAPYNHGTCEWFTERNMEAPASIYKDDYELSSLSCACSTEDQDNCQTTNCFSVNATKAWGNGECAIMYQERNCRSCYFKPISLHRNDKFLTLNSYQFKSMIVRPGCQLDKETKVGVEWSDNWKHWTDVINGVVVQSGNSYHENSNNYTCYCNPTTVDENHTETLPLETTTPPVEMRNDSCAYIKPLGSKAVQLYENLVVDGKDFDKIRMGKLKGALFAVGLDLTDDEKCVLEICGFSSSALEPYNQGTCEWYIGKPIKAPFDIYKDDYEVSSVGCACRTNTNGTTNCILDTCQFKNATRSWTGRECAVLFREKECRSCYFKPVSLIFETEVLSLNSHQFKSMIIRPGCYVQKTTNGTLWIDIPYTFRYTDVVNSADPTYHKDSENFNCFCNPQVISEMLETETTTLDSVDSSTDGRTDMSVLPASTLDSENKNKGQLALITTQYIIFGGGALTVGIFAVVLIKRYANMDQPSADYVVSTLEQIDGRDCGEIFPDSNDKKEINRSSQHIEMNVVPDVSTQHSVSIESELLPEVNGVPAGQTVAVYNIIESNNTKANENQLKSEIMEEVRKLMGSFVNALGHDDIPALKAEPFFPTVKDGQDKNESEFQRVFEKFNQVCHKYHILPRDAFTIPNRNLENPLGVGQGGIVYKGMLRTQLDGLAEVVVAVKKIKLFSSHSFLREVKNFERIGSGNEFIVTFLGACCHNDGLYLLTEFCEGGSLRQCLIQEMRSTIFQLPHTEITIDMGDDYFTADDTGTVSISLSNDNLHKLLKWCEQIACGMEYLSLKGIIHIDLALRNILLSSNGSVKICDFGLSKICSNKEDCAQSLLTGDFPFNSFAPELNTENPAGPKKIRKYVDIWAFGCTVYEMFTMGDPLYPNVEEQGVFKFVAVKKLLLEGYRHPKPPLAPDYVYNIMEHCWKDIPKDRPNFRSLYEFFKTKRLAVENEM